MLLPNVLDLEQYTYTDHRHHNRFWYLRCCSSPSHWGWQHLATSNSCSPSYPIPRIGARQVADTNIISHTLWPRLYGSPSTSAVRYFHAGDGVDAWRGTCPNHLRRRVRRTNVISTTPCFWWSAAVEMSSSILEPEIQRSLHDHSGGDAAIPGHLVPMSRYHR